MLNRIIDAKIEKEVYEGYGLAFTDSGAVFAPFTTKGDIVSGNAEKKGKVFFLYDYSFTEKSDRRIEAPCPHYGKCGGCSYQHLEYEDELTVKRDIVCESLKRIAKNDFDAVTVQAANRFYYRSHATFVSDKVKRGLYRWRSHDIEDLTQDGCLLCDKAVSEALLHEAPFNGSLRIAASFDKSTHSGRDTDYVTEHCSGLIYRHGSNDFFQSNIYLREALLATVGEFLDAKKEDRVCDLGCGCGFFSLYIAHTCNTVTGVDIVDGSIHNATENARINFITNATFLKMKMEDFSLNHFDAIIVDPPRRGLDKACAEAINTSKASRVVYVSCNPSTLARDIARLGEGGFAIQRLAMLDMFPCTYHIETVTLLVR